MHTNGSKIMKIDSKDKIANIPILKVRDFLKKYSNNDLLLKSTSSRGLNISDRKSSELINHLLSLEYIESDGMFRREKVWKKTLKGSTFSLASAANPVYRKTAGKHLSLLLERAQFINNSMDFILKIKKIEVFGSYLSEAKRLNDVDVAVELEWKKDHPDVKGKEKTEAALQHAEKPAEKGRNFDTFLDWLTWPERQVILYLKAKSRVISIHTTDDKILDRVEKKTLFEG